jgi:hypothetical protein
MQLPLKIIFRHCPSVKSRQFATIRCGRERPWIQRGFFGIPPFSFMDSARFFSLYELMNPYVRYIGPKVAPGHRQMYHQTWHKSYLRPDLAYINRAIPPVRSLNGSFNASSRVFRAYKNDAKQLKRHKCVRSPKNSEIYQRFCRIWCVCLPGTYRKSKSNPLSTFMRK